MRGMKSMAVLGAMLLLAMSDAGCGPARASADPGKAVVAIRLVDGGYQPVWTGTSLGDGQVVTYVHWQDKNPPPNRIEVSWADGKSTAAGIVKVEEQWGIVLLRTQDATLPALGPTVQLKRGDKVFLLGREELPPGSTSQQGQNPLGPLREVEGEVTETGVALPDPVASTPPSGPLAGGSFIEVRAVAWPGLSGGLVVDAQRRPAAVVRLVQIASSGKPVLSYALPLEQIKGWAFR